MTEWADPPSEERECLPIHRFSERAYLEYSRYVILDRALPHLGDGLKPVQRRILYAMSELGLSATAKFKKSARTVGDVLGKFHPHGDTACYEAMVLMAQPFAYRYPLIEGQGNWGAPDDPKSFAAMRYTEARLSPYAETLLGELDQGAVTWRPNFDGTLREPALLPARLPNLLLNGAAGIAVGMATDIPPHHLGEVVQACIHLLSHPDATLGDLMDRLPGPDYPTGAEIITPPREIRQIYERGTGSLRVRARFTVEEGNLVFFELPYQVSGSRVLAQIAAQMQAKRLPMVRDLRDESDQEYPTRLVIVPKTKGVDREQLASHLFATTDLERTYRVNLNLIGLDGKPRVMDLGTLLREWLRFRTQTLRRRMQHRLDRVQNRLHLLEGFRIAFRHLDAILRILRQEDDPKSVLQTRFDLSDAQAEGILNTRLRQLARLEARKLQAEWEALQEERGRLARDLESDARLRDRVKEELRQDAETYGDRRRSVFRERVTAVPLEAGGMAPPEPLTVILSERGWVRAAKGHDLDPRTLSYRAGDGFLDAARVQSHQRLIFLDTGGRVYSLPARDLPSARGPGEPLTKRLAPPADARFIAILGSEPERSVLIASDAGYGFRVPLRFLATKRKGGKVLLRLPEGANPLPPVAIAHPNQWLAAATNRGQLLVFPVAELPELTRGKGHRILAIPPAKAREGERLIALTTLDEGARLVIRAGLRHFRLKPRDLALYRGARGQRGRPLPRGLRRVDRIEVA